MNKKLLPLAIAAAMGAGAAQAQDITIYGQMHYSVDFVETDSPAVVDQSDWATGLNRGSYIGVKGSEDLGNGLKAIFKIESSINANVGSRNTYVGLTGDWGTMLMGRHETPYKMSTGSLGLFHDTIADYNAVIGNASGGAANSNNREMNLRVPQTIAYVSPNMNGLTVAGAWVQALVDEGVGGPTDTNAVSLAAMYSNGPLFASLAYEDHDNGFALAPAGISDASAWKLGLGYKASGFTVGFIYETIDTKLGNNGILSGANADTDNMLINGSYSFGNNVVKAVWGQSDPDVAGSTASKYWGIGLDHKLSKRTKAYAIYADMDQGTGGNILLSNGAAGGGAQYAGDHHGFSFGLIHKF